MPHTSANKRDAIVRLGFRVPSPRSVYPAPNVTQILVARCVSRTTRIVPRRQNPFLDVSDAVRPVEFSRKAISTNVANGYVKSVNRSDRWGTCVMRHLNDVSPAKEVTVL